MTDQQRFFEQQLTGILRPGEHVITRGVAEASVAWVFAVLTLGLLSFMRRFYYMAVTTQRVILLKAKRQNQWRWTPLPGLRKVPALKVEEASLLEWPNISRVKSKQSPAHMILGWRGCGYQTSDKKEYLLLVKRSDISFPDEQGAFYSSFFGKSMEIWRTVTGRPA